MKSLIHLVAAAVLLAAPGFAAEAPEVPDPGVIFQVEGDVHIATIENRNTVILLSDERVLISETNFTRNAETLAGLIASITDAPVEMAVTTHWHGDHNGGNAYFAEHGATIMAHENTRIRMMNRQINPVTGGVQLEPQPAEMLPQVTIKDGATIHWGDETVEIVHYPTAHTDSDLVLYYQNANVIFVGGLLEYPTYAGVYNPQGFIDALNAVVARADANSKIIPWQGPVISRAELLEWRDIIETMREKISAMIDQGMTLEQIVAANPSAEFDEKWGGGRSPDRFAQDMHYVLTNDTRD
jgi:glyoxylase-like metal-dependent hydrolase (beta-lactamase superfamily II)